MLNGTGLGSTLSLNGGHCCASCESGGPCDSLSGLGSGAIIPDDMKSYPAPTRSIGLPTIALGCVLAFAAWKLAGGDGKKERSRRGKVRNGKGRYVTADQYRKACVKARERAEGEARAGDDPEAVGWAYEGYISDELLDLEERTGLKQRPDSLAYNGIAYEEQPLNL